MYLLRYAALTHPGKVRDRNEDNYYLDGCWRRDIRKGSESFEGERRDGFLLASVCDGMGGQEMGEVASLTAVETMHEMCRIEKKTSALGKTAGQEEGRELPEYLRDYVEEANRRICQRMRREGKRLGTTLSILEFSGDTVTAANLGDSRIYRLREGKLEMLSTDHTIVARMLRQGQITQAEAADHPMRHRITQYLGIFPEEMVLEPAVAPGLPLKEGDCYLICSDGLTDMVPEEDIQKILETEELPRQQAEELVRCALEAGGRDNVTAVVVQIRDGAAKTFFGRIKDMILKNAGSRS